MMAMPQIMARMTSLRVLMVGEVTMPPVDTGSDR